MKNTQQLADSIATFAKEHDITSAKLTTTVDAAGVVSLTVRTRHTQTTATSPQAKAPRKRKIQAEPEAPAAEEAA